MAGTTILAFAAMAFVRIAAQIIAVEFDQVEGVEENAIIVVPVMDAVVRRFVGAN